MKVTQVALRATHASELAGRVALTPELLAAVGARYSRNNEGLDSILDRIDPANLDRSVDSIFQMIDYGHQSIADMVPVAIFIDELSIFLAYLIWELVPTAGGQESSTRYIRLNREGVANPDHLGIPTDRRSEWMAFIDQSFDAYASCLAYWEALGTQRPELTKIPAALLSDQSERAQKQVARMRRNFAFDRARYFLPVAAKTNMMLIMSARGWVRLCQHLSSHWLPEAVALGALIRSELSLAAPRMIKHAGRSESFHAGQAEELQRMAAASRSLPMPSGEAPCVAEIQLFSPSGMSDHDLAGALAFHQNRYQYIGPNVARTMTRFSWSAVAIAEIRDLNRHRTGTKYCPLVPRGFYAASDQVPPGTALPSTDLGLTAALAARSLLSEGCPGFVGWLHLGTQFSFEHTTTLDKFVYEAELRTGPGAHYRYAAHLRDSVALLGRTYPELVSRIGLGLAEPE